MELFLYSALLFLFLESLCDPLYHRPALPICSHMFLYLAIVFFFPNVLSLFYGCSVFLTLLALRVLCSLWPSAGDPRVCLMLPFLVSSLELCVFPHIWEGRLCQGSLWQLSVFTCSPHRAVLTGQSPLWPCHRGDVKAPISLVFWQELWHQVCMFSRAFHAYLRGCLQPQCHLLCILGTPIWSVLMCSLVLSVSIFLVCGLRGR